MCKEKDHALGIAFDYMRALFTTQYFFYHRQLGVNNLCIHNLTTDNAKPVSVS